MKKNKRNKNKKKGRKWEEEESGLYESDSKCRTSVFSLRLCGSKSSNVGPVLSDSFFTYR